MAEVIGIEPISPFLNGGLANPGRTLQHNFQESKNRHNYLNSISTVLRGIVPHFCPKAVR